MDNKIDLGAILDSMYQEDNDFDIDCPGGYEQAVDTAKELARRAVHQALVLASENATATAYSNQDGEWAEINEQSILDIEKLIV